MPARPNEKAGLNEVFQIARALGIGFIALSLEADRWSGIFAAKPAWN